MQSLCSRFSWNSCVELSCGLVIEMADCHQRVLSFRVSFCWHRERYLAKIAPDLHVCALSQAYR